MRLGQTQVFKEVGDRTRRTSYGPAAVTRTHLRETVPNTLQTRCNRSLLSGTALGHLMTPTRLHESTGEQGGPFAHGLRRDRAQTCTFGGYIVAALLFQCFLVNDHHGNTHLCPTLFRMSLLWTMLEEQLKTPLVPPPAAETPEGMCFNPRPNQALFEEPRASRGYKA